MLPIKPFHPLPTLNLNLPESTQLYYIGTGLDSSTEQLLLSKLPNKWGVWGVSPRYDIIFD